MREGCHAEPRDVWADSPMLAIGMAHTTVLLTGD
jgi:hypothetical protein